MTAKQATAERRVATIPPAAEGPAELLDHGVEQAAARIDTLAGRYAHAIESTQGHLQRALILARGLELLRKTITPAMMAPIMGLMNTPNGFMTDRPSKSQPQPYSEEVVKECFITALLHRLYPVNNEWNIIAGRFYPAQNGYRRLLREVEGITDIRIAPGVPTLHNGQTVVRVAVSWVLDGRKDQLIDHDGKPGMVFPVITHGGGPDQAIGKALRKALKAAYEQAKGSKHTIDDGEVDEEPVPAEDVSQVPDASEEEGPRAYVERLVQARGLAGAVDLALEALAKHGVGEASLLALYRIPDRRGLTLEHLVSLKQALDGLEQGENPATLFPGAVAPKTASARHFKNIHDLMQRLGYTPPQKEKLCARYGLRSLAEATEADAASIIQHLQEELALRQAQAQAGAVATEGT